MNFLGTDISMLSTEDICSNTGSIILLATLNAEFFVKANRDKDFSNLLQNFNCVIDGQIPLWMINSVSAVRFSKISGSDLIEEIMARASLAQFCVYAVGGTPEGLEGSINRAREVGIKIFGMCPEIREFPFHYERESEFIREIIKYRPRFVLVGLGAGKQERFILRYKNLFERNGVKVCIGCGGSFEFYSRKIKRAPKWLQSSGLEIFYRLLQEPSPRRLKRIYVSLCIIPMYLRWLIGRPR